MRTLLITLLTSLKKNSWSFNGSTTLFLIALITSPKSFSFEIYGALGHSGIFLFEKSSEKSYIALSKTHADHKCGQSSVLYVDSGWSRTHVELSAVWFNTISTRLTIP